MTRLRRAPATTIVTWSRAEPTSAAASASGSRSRALLVSNPSVVVLDEATAALDPITEKTIDDNLRRRGCTASSSPIASTIRDCDEIIVLQQGRIAERERMSN